MLDLDQIKNLVNLNFEAIVAEWNKYEKEEKPVRDLERLRIERNNLLSQSDWVVIKEKKKWFSF